MKLIYWKGHMILTQITQKGGGRGFYWWFEAEEMLNLRWKVKKYDRLDNRNWSQL